MPINFDRSVGIGVGAVGSPPLHNRSQTAAGLDFKWPAPSTSASASAPVTASGGDAAGEMLVFSRAGDGYGKATFFVADDNGTNERLLLEYGDIECCASRGGDGSRVVFAVVTPDGQIAPAVINIDGSLSSHTAARNHRPEHFDRKPDPTRTAGTSRARTAT
jgi:hypothetical protein